MENAKSDARPLTGCTQDDLVNHHALVYGRVRIWHTNLFDNHEIPFHWSKHAWWKALWYPHRGEPSQDSAWGVYAGSDGHTGPGDAELTHFMRLPPAPQETKP